MGAIGGMLGTAGGTSGTGIKGPGEAHIQQGTSIGDVQGAQAGTANSLASQNALLSALQGQNGLGQQNAVGAQQQNLANQLAANNGAKNQAAAMSGQTAFNNQLAAANGIGTQNAAIQGLQNTAGMYQDIAQGRGPNPAQAALNQATGQNVANQAALMAGQRGAGANVGLMARQAAQQGAATQQQAVGQGATLQAQQQVNALAGLGNTQQAIGGLGSTQAGMQQAGISQQGAMAGQQIAAQQAQQQAMANQANAVAGQQIAGTNANTQANLANQGQMQGALAGINNNVVGSQNSINAANAGLASKKMEGQRDMIGGALSGAASAVGTAVGLAGGGEVQKMADGGLPAPNMSVGAPAPSSSFGQFLAGWQTPIAPEAAKPEEAEESPPKDDKSKSKLETGASKLTAALGKAAMAANGGLASSGGHVAAKAPAQKAVKSGNSYDNDKIPAKLSEGEIVLPRTVTMSADPVKASADFVAKVLAKRKSK